MILPSAPRPPVPSRWCSGPCGRLLSLVAFERGDVCNRCRRNARYVTERALAAFERHLALQPEARAARRKMGRAA